MSIPYTLGESSFSFFYKAKQYTVNSEHHNFQEIVNLVCDGDGEGAIALVDQRAFIARLSFGDVIIDTNDIVRFRGEPVPDYLAHRILRHADTSPALVVPLMKFAEKLMGNPTLDVREDLYRWLEAGSMPIYPDGDFMAYKTVRSDYRPIHMGGSYGQRQAPGDVVEQPRETCEANRDVSCASGLHFCSYSYLPHFQSMNDDNGGKVIILKINPADVVAIPYDYNLAKGRCCRFEVVGEIPRDKIKEEFGNSLVLNESTYTPHLGQWQHEWSDECKQTWNYVEDEDGLDDYERNRIINNSPALPRTPTENVKRVSEALTRLQKQDRRNQAREAIAKCGSKTKAAEYLGIPRSTLYNWLNYEV